MAMGRASKALLYKRLMEPNVIGHARHDEWTNLAESFAETREDKETHPFYIRRHDSNLFYYILVALLAFQKPSGLWRFF